MICCCRRKRAQTACTQTACTHPMAERDTSPPPEPQSVPIKLWLYRYINQQDGIDATIALRECPSMPTNPRQISWKEGEWHGTWSYDKCDLELMFNCRYPKTNALKTVTLTQGEGNQWHGKDQRGYLVTMELLVAPPDDLVAHRDNGVIVLAD